VGWRALAVSRELRIAVVSAALRGSCPLAARVLRIQRDF